MCNLLYEKYLQWFTCYLLYIIFYELYKRVNTYYKYKLLLNLI